MEDFSLFIGQLGLKDVFDIFVVSLLIYQLLMIAHGTRAVQMLLGLFFLIILYGVSVNYNLYALDWILTHFFDSFFIFFIILFQEQIRAALTKIGTRKSMWRILNREEIELDVEEIVEAAWGLGKKKIGALFVFERTHGLVNYMSTGTILGSELHSDVLFSIFQRSSPLHDGAVIIRDGKIAAAGCFLPLSKNINVDRHFGTRHRAALGVSEVSDAVVLIVSEESGSVSLCIAGSFYSCETEKQLRQYLLHIWAGRKLNPELSPIIRDIA